MTKGKRKSKLQHMEMPGFLLQEDQKLSTCIHWSFSRQSIDAILLQCEVQGSRSPLVYVHLPPDQTTFELPPMLTNCVCQFTVHALVSVHLLDHVVAYHCVQSIRMPPKFFCCQSNAFLAALLYQSLSFNHEFVTYGDITVQRDRYYDVTIRWHFADRKVGRGIVFIHLKTLDHHNNNWYFHIVDDDLEAGIRSFRIPRRLPSGQKFGVTVVAVEEEVYPGGQVGYTCQGRLATTFRTELTPQEIKELHTRALNFLSRDAFPNIFIQMPYFSRNKQPIYFEDIMHTKRGIMAPYFKTCGGDPASPLNGTIKGLFFGLATDLKTGQPTTTSIFGTRRISIPSDLMFNSRSNLYFSDFYCHTKHHRVLLVLTFEGFECDRFCKSRLLQLNKWNNEFLILSPTGVKITTKINVEILFTEPIDVAYACVFQGAFFSDTIPIKEKKQQNGAPKNPVCPACNLYFDEFSKDMDTVVNLVNLEGLYM